MGDFHVQVGDTGSFSKTVSEFDVYSFAGITGDLSPNHVDEAAMKKSGFGQRMAHGALLVGFMSTACTNAIAHARDDGETPVSVGFDRIRFLKPVFLGDTVTTTYRIADIDIAKRRSMSDIEVVNQHGDLVCVGRHILQWVPDRPG